MWFIQPGSSIRAALFVFVHCLFYLQSGDHGQPDQSGLPSPQSDLYTPPVEDIQVTDIFYEDTDSGSLIETPTFSPTVSVVALPGQILEELSPFLHSCFNKKKKKKSIGIAAVASRAVRGRNLRS